MNDFFQSGQHPDVDQLNAFVEHALPPHEHAQTLAHLAECEDCRATVYFSQQAALDAAPAPSPAAPRRSWLSSWHLAWPIAAALACMALITVYLRNSSSTKKTTPDTATHASVQPPAAPPDTNAPLPPRQLPKAVPTPAVPMHLRRGPVPPTMLGGVPAPAVSAGTPAIPHSNFPTQLSLQGRNVVNEMAAGKASGAASGGLWTGGGDSSGKALELQRFSADSDVTLKKNEQQLVAGNGAMPPGPPPSTLTQPTPAAAPSPAAPATGTTVEVSANNPTVDVTDAGAFSSAINETLSVPSHLAVVSSIAHARQVLAVDTAGALFYSEDSGNHWKRVPAPWKGKPVRVSLAATSMPVPVAAADAVISNASGMGYGAQAPKAELRDRFKNPLPGNASLQGVLTDVTGAVIPGASVVITPTGATDTHTVKTDRSGRYAFDALSPGAYELQAQSPGFVTRISKLMLSDAQHATLDLKLSVGQMSETVTVEAQAPMVPEESLQLNKTIPALPTNAAGPHPAVFELTTETGLVWSSSDGLHWQPR